MHVDAIYIAPVKSLALQQRRARARHQARPRRRPRVLPRLRAQPPVHDAGLSARSRPSAPSYVYDLELLRFEFPDGRAYRGGAELRRAVWRALLRYVRRRGLRSVPDPGTMRSRSSPACPCVSPGPSANAAASTPCPSRSCPTPRLQALRDTSGESSFEARRFRPERLHRRRRSSAPGGRVARRHRAHRRRRGDRVRMRDSRCVMTTLNPDSGRSTTSTRSA